MDETSIPTPPVAPPPTPIQPVHSVQPSLFVSLRSKKPIIFVVLGVLLLIIILIIAGTLAQGA